MKKSFTSLFFLMILVQQVFCCVNSPALTSPTTYIVCNNTVLPYTATCATPGVTISWTRAAVANISNAAVTVPVVGDTPGETLVNTGTASVNVTYIFTTKDGACTAKTTNVVVTVRPTATVAAVAAKSTCNGVANVVCTFTPTPSVALGSTCYWTNDNTGIGLPASGSGTIAASTFTCTNPSNSTNNVANITVTPTMVSTAGNCPGTPLTFTYTVKPIPALTTPLSNEAASGAAQSLALTGTVAGSTYRWSRATVTGISNAAVSNSATNPIVEALINTTTAPVTAVYGVYTIAASCTSALTNMSVTVGRPVASIASQTFCAGFNTTPVKMYGVAWTNSNPAIGLAASGKGDIPSFLAVNNTASPITATISYTGLAANTFTITINPSATVNTINNNTVCVGATVPATTVSGPQANTLFTWTNDNPDIGLASSGTGDIPSFVATNATASPITANITVTPTTSGYAYMTDAFNGVAYKISRATNLLTNTITGVGSFFDGVGISASSDGNWVYIANQNSGTVSKINTTTNAVTNTIALPAGADPTGLVVTPDGKSVYIANSGLGTVSVINTATNTVSNNITLAAAANPVGITVNPDGTRVYVARSPASGNGTVSFINTTSKAVVDNVTVGNRPSGMVVSPDGKTLYVANWAGGDATISKVDLATKVVTTSAVFTTNNGGLTEFNGLAISPDGLTLYVGSFWDGAVHYFNTANSPVTKTGTINMPMLTGESPVGVSISADGKYVYASNNGNGGYAGNHSSLNVIDASTKTVVATYVLANPGGQELSYSFGNFATGVTCDGTPLTFTITVNPPLTPSVSIGITSGSQTTCSGAPVTFTATPTDGGVTPNYDFKVNGSSVQSGTSATYTTSSLANGNVVTCVMTPTACATPTSATSNGITMTVTAASSPSVSIAANPVGSICTGASVTFTATPTNGGANPNYDFQVNGSSVQSGTSATYTTNGLANNDVVNCIITPVACASPASAASNDITMTVNAPVTPSVSIAASPSGSITSGTSVTFTATPTNGGGAPTYDFKVNGSTVQNTSSNTYTTTTLANGNTVTCVITSNASCASPATGTSNGITMTVTAGGPNTWTGATDTSWFNTANWSAGVVPSGCGVDVSIPAGTPNRPAIAGASVTVGDVSIASGATLALRGQNLSLCGDWQGGSSSAAVIGSGVVVLNGTAPQTISGNTQFQTLQINNTNGGVAVQTGAVVDIYTALNLQAGNFNATNGTVTLKSTSASSAAILNNFSFGAGGTYTGQIKAERRYAPAVGIGTFNQHFMGSPVNSIPLSQFGVSGTPGYITPKPNCDELQSAAGTPYGSVFELDQTHNTGCGMSQWKVLTAGPAINAKGYSILKVGAGTLTLTGTPNLATSYTIPSLGDAGWSTPTLQGRTLHSGWHLISNPYSATLDAATLAADNSANVDDDLNFDPFVYVWQNSGPNAGSYQPATSVAPFQAFMVHKMTPDGSADYVINATARTIDPALFYREQSEQELKIVAKNVATGLIDETMIGFNKAATAKFDGHFDADKIPGSLNRHTLYTGTMDRWMSINTLSSIEETSTVPVGMEPGINGTFTFSFEGINSFDPTSYITLEDKKLNVMHDVRSGAYTFDAKETEDWNRFVLHFTPAATINTSEAGCNEQGMINIIQPGSANWNYTITDQNSTVVTTGTVNSSNVAAATVTTGIYTVTLKDNNGYTVVKNVEITGAQPVVASFTTPATTVEQGTELSFTSTAVNASDNGWNFGDGTTGTGTTTSHVYQAEGVYQVTLIASSSTGCLSTASSTVTVTSRSVTGINELANKGITIWSNDNLVTVDFTKHAAKQATIDIYNLLGQQISSDKFNGEALYRKEIGNMEIGYVVVRVKNGDDITTRKLMIVNTAK